MFGVQICPFERDLETLPAASSQGRGDSREAGIFHILALSQSQVGAATDMLVVLFASFGNHTGQSAPSIWNTSAGLHPRSEDLLGLALTANQLIWLLLPQ